jgi:ribosomal protein S27E
MIIECEHCGEILGNMRGNTLNLYKDVEVELTGKIFGRRQLISITCPCCQEKREVLE